MANRVVEVAKRHAGSLRPGASARRVLLRQVSLNESAGRLDREMGHRPLLARAALLRVAGPGIRIVVQRLCPRIGGCFYRKGKPDMVEASHAP